MQENLASIELNMKQNHTMEWIALEELIKLVIDQKLAYVKL